MLPETDKEESEGDLLQVARETWILPMSETPVLNMTEAGLMLIESHPNTYKARVAVNTSGIMDVSPGCPFHLLVENFAEKSAHLPKQMLVTVGGGAPKCVVHMGRDE